MNPADTLFITDLDGTLLNAEAQVSAESRRLLNAAISLGAQVSVATARTPATVSRLLDGVNLRLPLIVMTGAAMWNPVTHAYSHVRSLAPEDVDTMLKIYKQRGVSSFIYSLQPDGVIHVYHTGKMSGAERKFISDRLDSPFKTFDVPADGSSVFRGDVPSAVLFFAMQPDNVLRPLYEQLLQFRPCRPVFYHDNYGSQPALLEVFSQDASKALALGRLKKITGVKRVVAFGDNVNDLPILREADVAVAVENAILEVKAVADIVIGRNDTDAVARYIHDAVVESNRDRV